MSEHRHITWQFDGSSPKRDRQILHQYLINQQQFQRGQNDVYWSNHNHLSGIGIADMARAFAVVNASYDATQRRSVIAATDQFQLRNAIQQHQQSWQQENVHTPSIPSVSNQNNQDLQLQQNQQSTVIAKDKPKRRRSAYSLFMKTLREVQKENNFPDKEFKFGEFSTKCSKIWKTMSQAERMRFLEMEEMDEERYYLEMENFLQSGGVVVGRGEKRKKIKDPNAPKKPLSAFVSFCKDQRNKMKALDYGLSRRLTFKELGEMWSKLDRETKFKYKKITQKDQIRYKREMNEYKQKLAIRTG